MRDRLIELLENNTCRNVACEKTCLNCPQVALFEGDAKKIADILLADGWMRQPCKVGDTVYQPSYKFTKCSAHDYTPRYFDDSSCCGCESACDSVKKPYIYKGTVTKISITAGQIYLAVSFKEKFDSSSFVLGKTVFLAREEAEQALVNYESSTIEKGGAE